MNAKYKIRYDNTVGDFITGHYWWEVWTGSTRDDSYWRDSGLARSEKLAMRKIAKALKKNKHYLVREGEL